MTILLTIDTLESVFDYNKVKADKKIFDIVYNPENFICFTKNYISLIENSIEDIDTFRGLIEELYNTERLIIETTPSKKNQIDEFVEIAVSNVNDVIPITYCDNYNLKEKISKLIIVKDSTPLDQNWIVTKLLINRHFIVSYQDFKNDESINSFFNNIYSAFNFTEVHIFDREQTKSIISFFKNLKIHYYTYLGGGHKNKYILIETRKEFIKDVGGRLKFYYTSNPRILHERKILFRNILITVDNSHNNLTIKEPTWDITVVYDSEKVIKWKKKCDMFYPLQ